MHPQEAGWISSAHLVFLLTTSSQKYGPFVVVTDQGQDTLTAKRWPTVHLSLPFLLYHPRLSSRKSSVAGSREEEAGSSWTQAQTNHRLKPCKCPSQPQSSLVIQEMWLNSYIWGSFVNAVWKALSILTTCQLCHLRRGEAGRRNSTAVLLTILFELWFLCNRFCCWHRFLPRWVLNKVLVELVFLPYLGHKTRIRGWKKPKDCLIKLVPCSVLSTFSRRGLTTSQRFSMHSELALSVKKGIPY